MFEELRDGYENKINKFLKPNGKVSPFKSFLLSFVMLLLIGAIAYYDYFLDGDDYYYPMLTILIIVLFVLTLLSALSVIARCFKKK